MTDATILVIDPNRDQRTILSALLRDRGYRVLDTADPEEALRLAAEWAPDLILGEHPVELPDGSHLCAVLLEDPLTADIPFLALTARAMPDEVEAARATHAAGVLLKPISFPRLLEAVTAVLDSVPAGEGDPPTPGTD